MLFILGMILLAVLYSFIMIVVGTVLANNYLTAVPDIDGPVIAFGAIFWPVTLIILSGIYVGLYFTKKNQ